MIRRPTLPFRSRATWLRDSLPASGQPPVEMGQRGTSAPPVYQGPQRTTRPLPLTRPSKPGQALVEFTLIVPILLILVIGLADLGRVFAAGVVAESAARDAAEIVAQQYAQDYPLVAPSPAPSGYYADLHRRGARVVCAELKSLPNTNFNSAAGDCSGMPIVLACVHDGSDDSCAVEPFGDPIPVGCNELSTPPTNALPGGTEPGRFVEVRVCYKFTPLTQSLLLPIPEIYLQRTRTFTVADY